MLKFVFAVLLLVPTITFGATLYVDNTLGSNCTSGNYSIANRSCTGNSGNGYTNIASALSASAAGDTINLRAGSYTSNVMTPEGGYIAGIVVKGNQTWQTYPGDMPSRAIITGGSNHLRVIKVDFVDNVTIRDLKIVGGMRDGIFVGSSSGTKIINNDVSGYNTSGGEYHHGIGYGDCCKDSRKAANGLIADNYVHDQAVASVLLSAGIGGGGPDSSNIIVERNRVENTGMGIWLDVYAGDPGSGSIPWTIRDNYVKNAKQYCYHIEYHSSWRLHNNVGDGCGWAGIFVRPGEAGRDMRNLVMQNNTMYNFGYVGLMISSANQLYRLTNSNIDNNIFYSTKNQYPVIVIGNTIINEPSNTYRNNLIYSSANDLGVCWGSKGTWFACDGGTTYADTATGMNSFNAVTSYVSGNIAGNPLLANPAQGDFRLCEGPGSPSSGCTGRSLAIDAGIITGLSYSGNAPDLGAFESAGGNAVLPSPQNLRVVMP